MGLNLLRAYPDELVARGYDIHWRYGAEAINCQYMRFGNNLPMNPAAGLTLFQAVTCSANDPQGLAPGAAVYMLAGVSTIRWLPTLQITDL